MVYFYNKLIILINITKALLPPLILLFLFHTASQAKEKVKEKEKEEEEPLTKMEKYEQMRKVDPKSFTNYMHSWTVFPKIVGKNVFTGQEETFETIPGFLNVVIFIASWCEPCQDLVPDIKDLEKKYSPLHTRFLYIFCQDSVADAQGFSNENSMTNGILETEEIKKQFHNPELPSVYVADRKGWLATRYINTNKKDVANLNNFLNLLTSY